jgi:hypothetical protein
MILCDFSAPREASVLQGALDVLVPLLNQKSMAPTHIWSTLDGLTGCACMYQVKHMQFRNKYLATFLILHSNRHVNWLNTLPSLQLDPGLIGHERRDGCAGRKEHSIYVSIYLRRKLPGKKSEILEEHAHH